ncbi:hypothetical protein LEP1GSC202_2182 [Leptospira yanagawae serovar Saopaulo str. Sao Paulo = ATCC 700523]|uniref:Uncharacterized protein n=1 Tax=Leptospira yanagawae serovar Saopaulo str. Sao Paulo = ATCC 700523 TaxID=1249483 RepID=A0A5E8HGD1_9LEPT|nr:hypothetical protein [Leptospira yanagawae]EOQ90334.1 hypothetical protein LEP1GSC202_2182 [Leptospira yanagawae serovar Saopaulo str. Sao Paulo = ATCC 700523]
MEKIRVGVFLFFLLILAVLTFSLSKSWRLYDGGYEVTVETPESKEKDNSPEPTDSLDLEDGNGKIYWKQYFIYPHGLVTESGGFGPDGILSHARNLYSISLKDGKVQKLFTHDVYIWDFFVGEFSKKSVSNTIDDPKEDVLQIEKKLLIFAVTEDSNLDGVLNYKDHKFVFLFDPDTNQLDSVLPTGFHFRKVLYNSSKNHLTLILGKNPEILMKNQKKKLPEPPIKLHLFDYDVVSAKGTLSGSLEAFVTQEPN